MAAGIVASSVLAFRDLEFTPIGNPLLLAMTFLLAFVMVSTFKYRSFKDLDLKERLPFKYLVLAILIVVVVGLRPEVNLFLLFLTYATLGAMAGVFRFGKKRIHPNVYMPEQNTQDPDLVEEEDEEIPDPSAKGQRKK